MDLKLVNHYSEKARTSISSIVKIILILSIAYAIYFRLWRILFINLLLLIVIFIPSITKKYSVKIPKEIEFIVLIFVITSFFLGEIRGLIIQIFFGITLGFIGFLIMLILYSKSKVKTNYFLVILFSVSFSLALGLSLELLKYYTKLFLENAVFIADYQYAMTSLTMVLAGSLIASILGYIYMKGHRADFLEKLVGKFKKENPNLFTKKLESPEEIFELIKKGESEKLEFKSTLRTNIHTNAPDKKIEISTLKTLTALLNTQGGSLLIGVSDEGTICGIERDNFITNDRFCLQFTNLVKEHIGSQHLPSINFELIPLNEKFILYVECKKSSKPVFLKLGKDEHFFIRVGPASAEIFGSKLIEYIKDNF